MNLIEMIKQLEADTTGSLFGWHPVLFEGQYIKAKTKTSCISEELIVYFTVFGSDGCSIMPFLELIHEQNNEAEFLTSELFEVRRDTVTRTGWINIYKNDLSSTTIYKTEDLAKIAVNDSRNYITTNSFRREIIMRTDQEIWGIKTEKGIRIIGRFLDSCKEKHVLERNGFGCNLVRCEMIKKE